MLAHPMFQRPPNDFASKLKEFRTSAGLTRGELACRAKVSTWAVRSYESGLRRILDPHTVARLADALELGCAGRAELERLVERRRGPRNCRWSPHGAAVGHNLPQRGTSFVGREREVAEVAGALRQHRAIAVLGAGGVGKTSVVIRAAGLVLDRFPDGVWLVDLGGVAGPWSVEAAIAASLGIADPPHGALIDAVCDVLCARRALLVLDNCERVASKAASAASAMLLACGKLAIVATSRSTLGMPGERLYRLAPFRIPPKPVTDCAKAARCDALVLFRDRARSVDPTFSLDARHLPAVFEIVRSLDGLPLAIELAASLMSVLSPSDLAKVLDHRLRLLRTDDPARPPRQRALAATLEWSYGILCSRDQRVLRRLGVLDGAWSLADAAMVSAGDGVAEGDIAGAVASLADQSLVAAERAGGTRYRLPESTRLFALEVLRASGEMDATRRRLARCRATNGFESVA